MKVLMTTDTVGGVWTYALELANALADRDVEVSLAAMGAPLDASQRRELRASNVRRAYAETCALEWMDDPWRDVARMGRDVRELVGVLVGGGTFAYDRPNVVPVSTAGARVYDGEGFVIAPEFTFGNAGRNSLTGPGYA